MNFSLLVVALIGAIMILIAVICGLITGLLSTYSNAGLASAVLRGAMAFGGALAVQGVLVDVLSSLS
ncbi:hypothetical protein [Nocardia sp. NPDC051832]|uniref:hypothetical protein n=1 Tax=Nocardia sp. NPDC051832 TaxID=3155673 RepID=UPI003442F69F